MSGEAWGGRGCAACSPARDTLLAGLRRHKTKLVVTLATDLRLSSLSVMLVTCGSLHRPTTTTLHHLRCWDTLPPCTGRRARPRARHGGTPPSPVCVEAYCVQPKVAPPATQGRSGAQVGARGLPSHCALPRPAPPRL
ncbi:hypothetical protein E2C01_050735 [Portunus trituberculatus]|uniref:Uncharacterized protein n=1 Tax=Portunus trituberculatus TaxID=210409 RepID=A0A5B7GGX6_PORTR|nr:hypothetical protein [Portunus trituberculatus]